jgi:hypothetical protein
MRTLAQDDDLLNLRDLVHEAAQRPTTATHQRHAALLDQLRPIWKPQWTRRARLAGIQPGRRQFPIADSAIAGAGNRFRRVTSLRILGRLAFCPVGTVSSQSAVPPAWPDAYTDDVELLPWLRLGVSG